jgi:hypothetical protein
METIKTFTANNEDELWQQVAHDMARHQDLLQYSAQLNLDNQPVYFDIDIDLGGGFEGGFSSTSFLAPVPGNTSLRFHLHEQDWVNELGTVFGLEDIKLGDSEVDEAFIIKTNQPDTLKALFADPDLRAFLLTHRDCELELKHEDDEGGLQLTFSKDDAILDPAELQQVYHWIRVVLARVSGE